MDKDSVGDIYDNTEMHPVKSIGPLFPWSPLARSHTSLAWWWGQCTVGQGSLCGGRWALSSIKRNHAEWCLSSQAWRASQRPGHGSALSKSSPSLPAAGLVTHSFPFLWPQLPAIWPESLMQHLKENNLCWFSLLTVSYPLFKKKKNKPRATWSYIMPISIPVWIYCLAIPAPTPSTKNGTPELNCRQVLEVFTFLFFFFLTKTIFISSV